VAPKDMAEVMMEEAKEAVKATSEEATSETSGASVATVRALAAMVDAVVWPVLGPVAASVLESRGRGARDPNGPRTKSYGL